MIIFKNKSGEPVMKLTDENEWIVFNDDIFTKEEDDKSTSPGTK